MSWQFSWSPLLLLQHTLWSPDQHRESVKPGCWPTYTSCHSLSRTHTHSPNTPITFTAPSTLPLLRSPSHPPSSDLQGLLLRRHQSSQADVYTHVAHADSRDTQRE